MSRGTCLHFWNFAAYDDICYCANCSNLGTLIVMHKVQLQVTFCLITVVLSIPEMLLSLVFLTDLVLSLMCVVTEESRIVAMQLSRYVLYL